MTDIAEIKALAETQSALLASNRELKSWVEKANGEIAASKSVEAETKSAMEKLAAKAGELTDKCLELERKLTAGAEESRNAAQESFGEQFVKSDAFQAMAQGRLQRRPMHAHRVELLRAITKFDEMIHRYVWESHQHR